MVFTTTTLFKGINCPDGEQCKMTNCIFSHDVRPQAMSKSASGSVQPSAAIDAEPPLKRRKVTYESVADKPPSRADQIRAELASVRPAGSATSAADSDRNGITQNSIHMSTRHVPPSLTRSVTPPPSNGSATSRLPPDTIITTRRGAGTTMLGKKISSTIDAAKQETLNPRLVANDPAGHNKRSLYLKHLHGELVKQNEAAESSPNLRNKHLLVLSDQELIKLALDEEEKFAKEQGTSYGNVIKLRIAAYRKMKVEDWTTHVKSTFVKDDPNEKKEMLLETGLTSDEELMILPYLVADQTKLQSFGYVPSPPSEGAAAEAAAAVEMAKNFEKCERCAATYQVFPDRNEEGRLTSRGPCKHHPSRLLRPQRERGDAPSGIVRESIYPCCNGTQGSPGCAEKEDHVFKANSPGRMHSIMPFMTTPENSNPAKDRRGYQVRAVTFDCEMGYTALGLELIRLTAVTWPANEGLLDILVRPLGAVVDLNSRFSGVFPEHFANAVPYDKYIPPAPTSKPQSYDPSKPLPMVETPARARALLCSFLTPTTPLLGHAIDNDLNAVRLCHPTIVDTIVLYPHPRGLPFRFGLKMLANKHLDRQIQTGGAMGHDSREDAIATGDLVRRSVGTKWKLLAAKGWKLGSEGLTAPKEMEVVDEDAVELGSMVRKALGDEVAGKDGTQLAGTKRRKKRPGEGGTAGDSTEDEEVKGSIGLGAFVKGMRRNGEGEVKKDA